MKTYIIMGALAALGYGIGRFTAPETVRVETKTITVEVKKKSENINEEQNTKIVEIVRPDGTKQTTTDTVQKKVTAVQTEINATTNQDTIQITEKNKSSLIVEGMVSVNVNNLSNSIVYGAHISNNFIGPIRVGAFAFTDSKAGLTLGIQF